MENLIEKLRRRILAAAISAASVIVVLQATILPGIFDFVTDLMMIGLIWIVGKLAVEKK